MKIVWVVCAVAVVCWTEAAARHTPARVRSSRQGKECECVPYYLCSNNTIITDGSGLIDYRLKVDDCEYLELCCFPEDTLQPTPLPSGSIEPEAPEMPESTQPTPELPDIPDSQPTPAIIEDPPTEPSQSPPTLPTSPAEPHSCGKRNDLGVSAEPAVRIAGPGMPFAEFGEFPWMVAILKQEPGKDGEPRHMYQCGGSLIHPRVVLTAAHCVYGKSGLTVRAGEWDTQKITEPLPTQTRAVKSMLVHEKFIKGILHNDVALLLLESAFQLGPHIGTVCLPGQHEDMDNRECVASGWGKDMFGREGEYQVVMKKVALPTVPRDQCQSTLRTTKLGQYFKLHSSFMCAGGTEGEDTCTGDGGSPLACPSVNEPGRYVQAGIVAWGVGCGSETPGVYVSVSHFRRWIDDQLSANNIAT